jgi:dTDP-glucose pyrophosphorylase
MGPSIILLAAGLSRRYGEPKQYAPLGPNGETLIDYSIYDALRSGFEKIIFVISEEFEDDFEVRYFNRLRYKCELKVVYQSSRLCVPGTNTPINREKPWGTADAILSAKGIIKEPFAVINIDDFYGLEAFNLIYSYCLECGKDRPDAGLVAFRLFDTLSQEGSVSRGICKVGENGILEEINEIRKIKVMGDDIFSESNNGAKLKFSGEEPVSMNMWGFNQPALPLLNHQFDCFLQENYNSEEAELTISEAVNPLVKSKNIEVKVLGKQTKWAGITYKKDDVSASKFIKSLIENGDYPATLDL